MKTMRTSDSVRLYRLSEKTTFLYFLTFILMNKELLNKISVREATEEWIREFSYVPGSVIEKLIQYDESVSWYDSDAFRLVASPLVECMGCDGHYEGDLSLEELHAVDEDGKGIPCEHCQYNSGDEWRMARPQYAFPCGWGTLFAPKDNCDILWFREHAEEVAALGIFVFESEDWEIMLGIDGGGFNFYEAYWVPLYRLRGLRWHDHE